MPALGLELQTTTHTLPLLLSTTIAAFVSRLTWKHASDRRSETLALHVLAFAVWGSSQLIVFSSTTLAWKVAGTLLTGAAITIVFVSWLVFALQYTGRVNWHAWKLAALLCVPPALLVTASLTNQPFGHHGLVLRNPVLHNHATTTFSYEPGVLAWTGALYLAALGLTAEYLLLNHYLGKTHGKRSMVYPAAGLLVGACLCLSFLCLAPFPHFSTTHYVYLGVCLSVADPRIRSQAITPFHSEETPGSSQDRGSPHGHGRQHTDD